MSAKLTTDQDDVAINGDLTRYRALLKIPGTVGAPPTVDAVLHSLAAPCSLLTEQPMFAGQSQQMRKCDFGHHSVPILLRHEFYRIV